MPSSLIPRPCPGRTFSKATWRRRPSWPIAIFRTRCARQEHDAHAGSGAFYAMIAQIDDQFARILQTLDETGQRDNAVIVFTSDHGEALGDHGLMYKGCRFYEGLVRIPLVFLGRAVLWPITKAMRWWGFRQASRRPCWISRAWNCRIIFKARACSRLSRRTRLIRLPSKLCAQRIFRCIGSALYGWQWYLRHHAPHAHPGCLCVYR